MRILLWDIDGTLVSTGGAGLRALARAISSSEGASRALERMRLDGMTDRKIARILCAAERHRDQPDTAVEDHLHQVTQAEIERVLGMYLAALRSSMQRPDNYRVLPGVWAALDALTGPDVVHALGTGNLEEGARLKLEHADLWRRFHFGGFGSDAEERVDILRAAWRKSEVHLGRSVQAEEFVVIGDTPKDIHAAHEAGLCCVAVASGRHSQHELAEAGADLALETLDAPHVPRQLLETVRRR